MVKIFLIADAEARTTGEIVRLIASQKAINTHIVSAPNRLWKFIRVLPAGNRLATKLGDDLEVDSSEVYQLTVVPTRRSSFTMGLPYMLSVNRWIRSDGLDSS